MNPWKIVSIILILIILSIISFWFIQNNDKSPIVEVKKPQQLKEIDVLLGIGNKYLENNEIDLALAQYRRALGHEPHNIDVINGMIESIIKKNILYKEYFHRGRGSKKKGSELQEALTYIFKAQTINTDLETDPHWSLNEAYVQLARGRVNLSIQALKKALTIYPQNPNLLAAMGMIKLRDSSGKLEAVDFIKQALNIHPEKKRFCYYLGEAYEQNDDDISALQEYYRCAQRPIPENKMEKNFHNRAISGIQSIFGNFEFKFKQEGILSKEITLPLSKRLEILEYLETQNPTTADTGRRREVWLVMLYLTLGQKQKAEKIFPNLVTIDLKYGKKFDYLDARGYSQTFDQLAKQFPNSFMVKALQFYQTRSSGDPERVLAPLESTIALGRRVDKKPYVDVGPTIFDIVDCGLASRAGLKEADVIKSINGKDTSTLFKLFETLDNLNIDQPVKFTIERRDTSKRYRTFSLIAKPTNTVNHHPTWLGFRREHCHTKTGYKGRNEISVSKVYPESPLGKSLTLKERPFDFKIAKINGEKTGETLYPNCVLPTLKPNDQLELVVQSSGNDKNPERLTITVETRPDNPELDDCDA